MQAYTHAYKYAHIHTCMRAHTHHVHTYMHVHTYIHKYIYAWTDTHTYTQLELNKTLVSSEANDLIITHIVVLLLPSVLSLQVVPHNVCT